MPRVFDRVNGGFGSQPSFPIPARSPSCCTAGTTTRAEQIRDIIDRTLQGMARGGIYDQLGGGFHRYSVDAQWIVPHFEKMSYDNSELLKAYARRVRPLRHRGVRRRGAGDRALGAGGDGRSGGRVRRQPGCRRGTGGRRRLFHLDPGGGRGGADSGGDGRRRRVLRHRHRRRDAPQSRQERAVRRLHRSQIALRTGRSETGNRALLDAGAEQAAPRAGSPAGSIRGSHPLHQLECHDGLRHAPRGRGPG